MELQSVYQFDSFQLDPAQKILQRDGQRVPLDPKTFLILQALVEAEGRVISKNELMARVWPDTFVEENNLTKNISRLRKSLGNGDESSEYIETIPKVGYRFCAEIRRLEQAEISSANGAIAAGDREISEAEETKAMDDSQRRPASQPARSWKLWSGLAVALVIGITAAWFGWRRPHQAFSSVVNEFEPVRLTNHIAIDLYPAYSPDGKKIAFISNRDGKDSLFVMDADGANPRKLISNLSSRVSWSPDGRRIVFAAARDKIVDVYVANADGSGVVQLTHTTGPENGPVWSPDGTKILFCYTTDGTGQLYVMNPDGSGVARISNSTENEWQHDWSLDGKQIVFTRSRDRDAQRDIWMMNADGANAHLIAASPDDDEFLFPRFSPDGQRIAFQRRVASPLQADIWVMNTDGSGQMRLTHRGGGLPTWSPDGKKIAFVASKRDGNSEIYVMDVAGQ